MLLVLEQVDLSSCCSCSYATSPLLFLSSSLLVLSNFDALSPCIIVLLTRKAKKLKI